MKRHSRNPLLNWLANAVGTTIGAYSLWSRKAPSARDLRHFQMENGSGLLLY
jgi:hypothetical protein